MATDVHEKNNKDNKSKVIIIGAGIAGISTAEYLSKNGFNDFKILEAAPRVGGRIWTYDIDGVEKKVEMGANWIHGIERNPIYQIADENGLLQLRYKDKGLRHKNIFIAETGEEVNAKVVKECDFTYGLLIQQCEEFYQMGMPTPYDVDSVGEYMKSEIAEKLELYSGNEKRLREMIFSQHLMQEAVVSGCNDLDDVSLSEFGCYEELPGVHYTIPPGFQSVLEILCSKVPQENIFLNHQVKCIKWGEEGSNDENYRVSVECENGDKFYANHVIVTVSLGVLKAACDRMFEPKLPADKLEAIDKLGFGTVDKVNLYFDEPIFEPDVFRVELLWDENKFREEERSPDLANTWYRKIYSFEVVHENLITGWLCGKEALYMESLSDDQVAEDCCNVLKKFLKKDIPLPTRVIRSRWGNDKTTRGSYCYIKVGAAITDVENLGEPLNGKNGKILIANRIMDEVADKDLHFNRNVKGLFSCDIDCIGVIAVGVRFRARGYETPVVQFAGEATHPSFYSTTHGALITGHREAKRILDLYELPYTQ